MVDKMMQAEEGNNSQEEMQTDSRTNIVSDSDSSEEKPDSPASGKEASDSRDSTLSRVIDEDDVANGSMTKTRWDAASAFYKDFMEKFHTLRHIAGRFVNNKDVQLFIVVLIGINGVMMGIGTFDFVRENEVPNKAFEVVDQIFLIIFTVELGLQFIYHGWRLFLDGWLIFDFVIITVSWSFSSVQIVRAFRIFRALRLITRIKVMKNLILALFSVIPRMFAIGLLLFLVSYIFAVMFTQLFKDLHEDGHTDYNYFGRIDDTFFTLFQIMTLDNWADIARQVMVIYAWAWFPFITFVIITGFVVVNLIIAVICDAVSALEDEERAKLHGTFGDDSTLNDESQHPALQEDVREQLDVLETYVDELSSMQEQTLRTLQILTRQLEAHKKARQGSSDSIKIGPGHLSRN